MVHCMPIHFIVIYALYYTSFQKGAKLDVSLFSIRGLYVMMACAFVFIYFDGTSTFDNEGMGVVHFHADAGELDALKCLTDAETVNVKSAKGFTPLHYAAENVCANTFLHHNCFRAHVC